MAKIKYDVTNVEAGGGGEQPQPGLYNGKIVSVNHRKKKTSGDAVSDLEVVVSPGEEYARLWTYIKLPDDPNYDEVAHGWKLREFTDAVALPPKGEIDPEKLKGKSVTIKVSADTDQDGEYRGRVKNLFRPGDAGDAASSSSASSNGDGEYTREELEAWDDDDLKAELKDRELTISGRYSKDKAIEALLEAAGSTNGDGNDAAEAGAAGDDLSEELLQDLNADAEFYAEWPDDDVKSYAEDIGVLESISGRKTRNKIVEAITEFATKREGGGAAADDDAAPEDDYDEWELSELEDEVNTRAEQGAEIRVSGRKTKEKLIEALRADDKQEAF